MCCFRNVNDKEAKTKGRYKWNLHVLGQVPGGTRDLNLIQILQLFLDYLSFGPNLKIIIDI